MNTTLQNKIEPSVKSSADLLVKVDGVSKKFCRSLKRSLWYGVQDVAAELNPFARSRDEKERSEELREGEFWAVNDVSFELRRGECLGLIGRNGAGKTTLLKMLNGLIKPDRGHIEMRGRVGALIALGAGFNPILTGRENIYVNASVLGLAKGEINEKIDEIIDFAEIRDFIDAPVQSYSSGMQVRLGFAVATALAPDVLILDEVLAVGDAAFRAKCYNRIVSLRKNAAVIFVTHSMEQVGRICDHSLLMSKGTAVYQGTVGQGIREYDKLNEVGDKQEESFLSLHSPFRSFLLLDIPSEVQSGGFFSIRMLLDAETSVDNFKVRISFYGVTGGIIAEINQDSAGTIAPLHPGDNSLQFVVERFPIRAGLYKIGFSIIDRHGGLPIWSYKQYEINVVGGSVGTNSECQIPVSIRGTLDR
jgi:lipopolysaccharide transport system ATP-binding protein